MALSKQEQQSLEHLDKGRYDIEYFARNVLGIDPNPSQVRWFQLINPAEDGWQWRMKMVVHVAANQIGKTLGLSIIVLWAATYKIGIPTDDPEQWYDAPYQWFHVAPSQNQAYLLLQDMRMIIRSGHPAQVRTGRNCILPEGFVTESNSIETYYSGLIFAHGAIIQFRTTEEKARALLGRRLDGISFDECAFERHLHSVINEVLMMRLIATGGPLLMVSTPNGMDEFYEIVTGIQDRSQEVSELRVWVNWDLRESVVWSEVRDNIGYGLSQEEVDRMEVSLNPDTKEQQLRGAFLSASDVYFIPQDRVINAFDPALPHKQPPKAGHKYVIFWDPSASSDPTACIVLDVTKKPWVGVYFDHRPKPTGIDRLIPQMVGLHTIYNGATHRLGAMPKSTAITAYDATSMGGAIIKQHLKGITPQKPVNFAGGRRVKDDALSNLRAGMLQGWVKFPASWTRLKREVLNYRRDDAKIEQDSVMAAAGAVSVAGVGSSGKRSQPARQAHARLRRRWR